MQYELGILNVENKSTKMKELDVICIESDEEEIGEPEIICTGIEDGIKTKEDPDIIIIDEEPKNGNKETKISKKNENKNSKDIGNDTPEVINIEPIITKTEPEKNENKFAVIEETVEVKNGCRIKVEIKDIKTEIKCEIKSGVKSEKFPIKAEPGCIKKEPNLSRIKTETKSENNEEQSQQWNSESTASTAQPRLKVKN